MVCRFNILSWLIVASLSSAAWAQVAVYEDRGTLKVVQDFVPLDASPPDGDPVAALGDTNTTCQENPTNAAIENIICTFSDLTAVGLGPDPVPLVITIADNFSTMFNGNVAGVTWYGFMIRRTGPNMVQDCTTNIAPVSRDNWTIRYYRDDGFGFPDPNQVIAHFDDPPVIRTDTGEDPFGLVSKFKMQYTFPTPIGVECGTNYHVEIYNNYIFNDCFFCWQPAPPGDDRSLQTEWDIPNEPLPVYNDSPDDINTYDMTLCQDLNSFGPVPNPPRVTLQRTSPPDPVDECCTFKYTVRNTNCIGAGSLSSFHVAFDRGNGAGQCESIDDISTPVGWTMSFCENWSTDNLAVFKFTGSLLDEQASTFGHIRTRVNGPTAIVRDAGNTIQPYSIRAWASVSNPPAGCFTGTFGPLQGQSGEWGPGFDGECALTAIPSASMSMKFAMTAAIALAGLYLVFRSRTVMVR